MCNRQVCNYKNWETATIAFDIAHDRENSERWQERGLDHIDPDALGDEIRDSYEEAALEVSGVFSTLLNASLEAVDWVEIGADVLNSVADDDDPYFDRFDVVEAWYLFLSHYHDGRGEGKTSYGRLSRMSRYFKPGLSVDNGDLSDNGRAIYRQLVKQHEGGW